MWISKWSGTVYIMNHIVVQKVLSIPQALGCIESVKTEEKNGPVESKTCPKLRWIKKPLTCQIKGAQNND